MRLGAATILVLVGGAALAAPGVPTPRADLGPALAGVLTGNIIAGPGLDSVMPPARQDALLACADAACTMAVLSPVSTDLAVLDVDALLVVRRENGDVRMRQVVLADGHFVEGRAPVCGDALGDAMAAALRMLASGGGVAPACPQADAAPVVASPPPGPQSSAVTPEKAGSGWLGLAGSLGVLAGGAVVVLASAGAAVAAVLARAALTQPAVVGAFPTPGLRKTPRFVVVQSPPFVLAGLAGVALLGGAGLCVAGGAWLVLHLVAGL